MDNEVVRVLVTSPLGVGGVTNMMIHIQEHLDRTKINFDYLVFHDRHEPMEDKVLSLGSKKYIASADNVKFRPFRRIWRINEIRKVCKKNHIKILHYNADCAADMTNIIGAKLGGVQYITIHSHNAGFGSAGFGIKIMSKILKPLIPLFCDSFYGCSELAARFLFPKSVIESHRYSVLPNGIDLEKYEFNEVVRQEVRKKLHLEGKYVVGHAGRFSDQKNHSFLLDIFHAVHKKNPNTVLLLFGVGELLEEMKRKCRKLGIENAVVFYGASNEMYKMWQAMDVFVMPSLHEGLPVTGIEAQASGLPCVFSDVITKEVGLTSNTEFISLQEKTDVWAEHVLKYMNVKRKSERKKLEQAGYEIQQTSDKLEELYLNVSEKL